ncbi:MAG TPA: glycosyltransferase [Amycolatopsis sp.]|uniref:glycosyltransferase n=1 Tax=Amycolatopsis sp. TaxID=37632 RepID=UPI002B4925F2|nr:glycosyltransferase [Amycolatopsis sp.]HKS46878.1 glycosyltransferase [Amycolatopsis sp.]
MSARMGVRETLGISPGCFVAVSVVPEAKRRGHDVLLDAWRGFHAEHPDSHLILVGGSGETAQRYRRELAVRFTLDKPDSGVTWVSTVEDERPYRAAADVCVSPSGRSAVQGVPGIVGDPRAIPAGSGWVVPGSDPDALATALREAYAEHRQGVLVSRGARVVEPPEPRPARVFSIFTQSRFAMRSDGRWTPLGPSARGQKWARYRQNGNEVRVIAMGDSTPVATSPPVPDGIVMALPDRAGVTGLPAMVAAVARAVAVADAIVLRVPGLVSSIAAVVCRILRRAYAVEVLGDAADLVRAAAPGPLGSRLAKLAESHTRWLVRNAAASLYVTHETLQRRYPRQPGTPTIEMSNVVLRRGTLAAHGRTWQSGPFRIITIGGQENHHKGHDVLLRALRVLVDDGLDVTATIIGGGRVHGELIELAHSIGLAARVEFVGVLDDRARIRELQDSASLFALPSRAEGMPRTLIEAMARALPAVGSRVGGVPELLQPSCLVPVGDHHALARAMTDLLTDPAVWEEQSRVNLKVAQTFEQSLLEQRFSTWLDRVPPAR